MARSPYQGTWQPGVRPTVVTAPDALVYINGEVELIGCPSCQRKFDIHKYLTNLQVDLSVDSSPGSASLSLSIPRHAIDDFMFEGVPVIQPMMEVEIFAKGHFLVEGLPQYYPIFWGLVTEVGDSFSGGQHTISINCADILHWWTLCKMNINPALTTTPGQQGRSIFGNVFFGTNPYDVIWTLAQSSFGDVVVGTGSLQSFSSEGRQQQTFMTAMGDIQAYWQARFSRMRSNLLLYGTQGVAVRGDTLYQEFKNGKSENKKPFASTAVSRANGGPEAGQMVFDPTSPQVVAFKTQFQDAGQVNFFQSEYQTKLELATAAKEAIGFEFYMDVTGDIVFKPPFFNLDVVPNKPVSWIQDIDIIDWNFSESEAEVVTQLQIGGSFGGGNIDYGMGAEVDPFTSVTDYHLLRKYGWRTQQITSEFLGSPMLMFYHGLDILDRLNSKRHRGSVNIPLRPELRLGFPVYVEPKDQIWYVSGISHTIAFGGRCQTTLTLTARRQKFFAPKGIGKLEVTSVKGQPSPKSKASIVKKYPYTPRQLSEGGNFKITVGEAASIPPDPNAFLKPADQNPYAPIMLRHPKSGRAVGYPNVVLAYTRPFAPSPADLKANSGQRKGDPKVIQKKLQKEYAKRLDQYEKKITSQVVPGEVDKLQSKYMQNRYMYGLNSAGVYTYLYDKYPHISELILVPASNITAKDNKGSTVQHFQGASGMIRPVSDERGFEVIGHFRYGRGLYLSDGKLISEAGKFLSAKVDAQLSLSGDLYATLNAQSQGLSTISTSYSNPSKALAELRPEDVQMAAVINPETKKPEFVGETSNFMDTAVLGSPEQKGSIEATQLSLGLTLAEMTVKMEGSEGLTACDCLSARKDLAFINSNYKVDTIKKGTTPDKTKLYDVNSKDPLNVTPVAPTQAFPVGKVEEIQTVVNNFLFGLYERLDAPHQELEEKLRGNLTTSDRINQEQSRFDNTPEDTTNNLTPPFSPTSRFAVGDPRAAAQQFNTSYDGLKTAWNDFSDNLKSGVKKVQLQADIVNLNAEIKDLEAQKEEIKQEIQNGDASNQPQLAVIESELAAKTQSKNEKELLIQKL